MSFTEDQQAFIREAAREVVKEAAAAFKESVVLAVSEHRLNCEVKQEIEEIKSLAQQARGAWKATGVVGTIIGALVGFGISLFKR